MAPHPVCVCVCVSKLDLSWFGDYIFRLWSLIKQAQTIKKNIISLPQQGNKENLGRTPEWHSYQQEINSFKCCRHFWHILYLTTGTKVRGNIAYLLAQARALMFFPDDRVSCELIQFKTLFRNNCLLSVFIPSSHFFLSFLWYVSLSVAVMRY